MAPTVTLGSLNLADGTTHEVRFIEVDQAPTRWDERERLFGVNRQARVRTSGLREIRIGMTTRAASADALRTAITAVRAECAKATNTLLLRHDGETTTLTYTLPRQVQPNVPWTELYELRREADYTLTLTAEPFVYGSEVTLINASSAVSPRTLDLSGIVGDYPAPLEITLAAANLSVVYLGIIPDLAYGAFAQAEALTWAGGTTSTVADAAASGGNKRRNTSTSAAVATLADTRAFAPGSYLPVYRAKVSANSMNVGYGYGGAEFDNKVLAATSFVTGRLRPVSLPIAKTRVGTPANFQVRFSVNVSGNAELDYFGLCPLSWGFAAWDTGHAAAASSVIFGYDGTCYADGAASGAYKVGGPIEAYKTDRLCIFTDVQAGTAPANVSVTVKYRPRYAQ